LAATAPPVSARPRPASTLRAAAASLLANGFSVRSTSMMDIVMLAIGLFSFALSIGYVYACDQL
jgi:hypothetical protein